MEELLILAAAPRSGNHLLRGLLDGHRELLVPPDEDYFVRQLMRSASLRLRARLCSAGKAPDLYREIQKNGHFEKLVSGGTNNSFDTAGLLDLGAYYEYVRSHHRRFSTAGVVRTHFEALEVALSKDSPGSRRKVYFCAMQTRRGDLENCGEIISRSYKTRTLFLFRDPRSHFHSVLGRDPEADVEKFCEKQRRNWDSVNEFEKRFGPVMRVAFGSILQDTERVMRNICEYSGIAFDPSVLEFTQGGQETWSNSSHARQRGIDPSAATRYVDELPGKYIDIIERDCPAELLSPMGIEARQTAGPVTPPA
jgi:hypothetical protein